MQKLWQSKKSSGRSISLKIMVLYFVFVLALGVSYAYFSATLRITGIASIDG